MEFAFLTYFHISFAVLDNSDSFKYGFFYIALNRIASIYISTTRKKGKEKPVKWPSGSLKNR